MKTSNKCPKCDGSEIYTNKDLMKQGERSAMHIGGMRRFLIESYICSSCGYLEEHVRVDDLKNQRKMAKLK